MQDVVVQGGSGAADDAQMVGGKIDHGWRVDVDPTRDFDFGPVLFENCGGLDGWGNREMLELSAE